MNDDKERFEIRLRATVPTEAALIDELTGLEGTYGGMNELMRKCLVRGFLLLEKQLQDVSTSSSEMAVLDAFAQAFDSDECDSRLLKTFMDARSTVKEASAAQGAAISPTAQGAHESPAIQAAQSTPDVPADQAALAQNNSPLPPTQSPTAHEQAPAAAKDPEIESSHDEEPIAPAPKKPLDWSAFRNVAGVAGDGGPAKAGGGGGEDGE